MENKIRKPDKKEDNAPRIKKRRTKRFWTIVTFIIFILIAIGVVIAIKVTFLTKNEIHIELKPLQKKLYTAYDKTIDLNFTIKNNNFWFCKAECTFSLYDPYGEREISSEDVLLESNQEVQRAYPVALETRGEGERAYYFKTECNNIQSLLCRTEEKKTYRSSFISIDYVLPEEEKATKDYIKPLLDNYSSMIWQAYGLVDELELIYADITKTKKNSFDVTEDLESINKEKKRLLELESMWKNDFYKELGESFLKDSAKSISSLNAVLIEKKKQAILGIERYNQGTEIANQMRAMHTKLNDSLGFYLTIRNFEMSQKAINLSKEMKTLIDQFKDSRFEVTGPVINALNNLWARLETFNQGYENDSLSFDKKSKLLIQKNQDSVNKLFVLRGENKTIEVIGINESAIKEVIKDNCDRNNQLLEMVKSLNAQSENNSLPYSMFVNDTNFGLITQEYRNSITKENYSITFNETDNVFIINGNTTISNTPNLTVDKYVKIITLDITQLEMFSEEYCSEISFGLYTNIDNEELKRIVLTDLKPVNNNIVKFADNPKKCCIHESCKECTSNYTKYPVIFLHGHSFNKETSVEGQVAVFYEIQERLSQELDYINAGDIDITTANDNELWTSMDYPVAVMASYYYIIYYDLGVYTTSTKKTESIESYAIRLKELIQLVKTKTGASKVNIVAHSMGGLVARDYMTLFGDNDINKLIMIATPNYGATGDVSKYCKNFGSDKECEDLEKDSIFLKKLNARTNIPNQAELFVIYGSGCDMQGKDGDGVVTIDSAKLDFAENYPINGSCTGLIKVNMHNDLLIIEKYPQVYEKVKELLSK